MNCTQERIRNIQNKKICIYKAIKHYEKGNKFSIHNNENNNLNLIIYN